jgi:hypothetical protein
VNLRPVASPAAVLVLIVAAVGAHYVVPESWLAAAFTAVVADPDRGPGRT